MTDKVASRGMKALMLLAAVTVIQASCVHGRVRGENDQPLAGAHVWIADSAGIGMRLETNANGRYFSWHRPFAYHTGRQLTCAKGHTIMVSPHIPRAWSVGLGLGKRVPLRNIRPQVSSDWTHAVPPECLENER